MTTESYIEFVSELMLVVALCHTFISRYWWKWGQMSRRPWVRNLFHCAAGLVFILALGRIWAYFYLYNNLTVKAAFGAAGTVMIVVDTAIFGLATHVMQVRFRREQAEPSRRPTSTTLAGVIDEFEAMGRRHGVL